MTRMTASDTTATGRRTSRRSMVWRERALSGGLDSSTAGSALLMLLVPNTRVHDAVDNVRGKVCDDKGEGNDQRDGHKHWIVPRTDGIEGQRADPGYTVEAFDDKRPLNQRTQREHDYGRHGDEGVTQDVPANDEPLRQALGSRGAHVVLPYHLQRGGAHHAGHASGASKSERHRRQDDVDIEDATPATCGEELERAHKDQEQHRYRDRK